jgi:hypothetical protein
VIKTKCFVSVFLLITGLILLNSSPINADNSLGEITLTTVEKPELTVTDAPEVYLPSKLIIGEKNAFRIKGNPGCKVSLAVSKASGGAKPLFGQQLRIGASETTIEGVIPATGIIELHYELPNDESLINGVRFFEVATWSKDDYSDLQLARIYSSAGRQTSNNGVKISHPYDSGKRPTFMPVIPGMGQDLVKAIDKFKEAKEGNVNPDLLEDGTMPAYLDSPEKREVFLQNIDTQK